MANFTAAEYADGRVFDSFALAFSRTCARTRFQHYITIATNHPAPPLHPSTLTISGVLLGCAMTSMGYATERSMNTLERSSSLAASWNAACSCCTACAQSHVTAVQGEGGS